MSPHHCSIAVDLQRLLLGTSHLRKIVGGHKPHGSPNRTWNSKSCPTQTWIHFLLQSLMRLYQIHDKFDNFTRLNLNHNVEMAVYWVLHESSIQSRQKFVGWPTKRPNPPCGHGEKHPHRGFPWQTWKGQQSGSFLLPSLKEDVDENYLESSKRFSSINIQNVHHFHTQTRRSNKSRSISLASSRDWFFLMKTSPINCFPSIRPSQE